MLRQPDAVGALTGDLNQPETLRDALAGVRCAFVLPGVLGRPPRTFEHWATNHAADFE